MKSNTLLRTMVVALMTLTGTTYSHALELMFMDFGTTYYGDCHITLQSPSSAEGTVYVGFSEALRKTDNNPTLQSAPGITAQLKANLSSTSGYQARLMAYPKAGYVLDGFVTKENYQAGKRSSAYFIKDGEKVCKSGDNVRLIPIDTLRDVKESDPTKLSNYRFTAKATSNICAVFRRAKSETVTVTTAGQLQSAVERTATGDLLDGIVVRGPIDSLDIVYLKKLSKDKNLVRIDLSAARITKLPKYAFSSCSKLYEIKLPSSGLREIGESAFYWCSSLKKFPIPSSVANADKISFLGCESRNLTIP